MRVPPPTSVAYPPTTHRIQIPTHPCYENRSGPHDTSHLWCQRRGGGCELPVVLRSRCYSWLPLSLRQPTTPTNHWNEARDDVLDTRNGKCYPYPPFCYYNALASLTPKRSFRWRLHLDLRLTTRTIRIHNLLTHRYARPKRQYPRHRPHSQHPVHPAIPVGIAPHDPPRQPCRILNRRLVDGHLTPDPRLVIHGKLNIPATFLAVEHQSFRPWTSHRLKLSGPQLITEAHRFLQLTLQRCADTS